jgi:UDP-3-O-[3-hydroxymyristoyl] N-acetylglucosamine deacetylase
MKSAINNKLLCALLADAEAWEYVTFDDAAKAPVSYRRIVFLPEAA